VRRAIRRSSSARKILELRLDGAVAAKRHVRLGL